MFEKMKGLLGKEKESIVVKSPLEGTAVPADQINDPAFREQLLGTTIGIKPAGKRVVAPVNGVVDSIFETGHAVTMISDDGVQIIIHIGLDTVNLKGRFFTTHVKSGDRISTGDLMIEFEKDEITNAGYDTITAVIICNASEFSQIDTVTNTEVLELDQIMALKK